MRVVLIAGILSLAACSVGAVVADNETGTTVPAQGSGSTRTYAVGGFDAVALRGSDAVDVRVGPGFSVRADGDPELLDHLRISKDGNTLQVGRTRTSGWSWNGRRAKVSITLPALASVAVAGSGDMSVDRVQGGSFEADAAGSGHLQVGAVQVQRAELSLAGSGGAKLAGHARQLKVSIAGSGDIDAGGLTASTADVSIAGSGSVHAAVDGPAKVSIMGSGDVDLGGKAQCQVSKMGSGSVRCGR